MEYLDLVNNDDKVIGVGTREYIDSNNLKNYRVINILIINSNDQIILAQRSKKKKRFGGCYFFSVGGHVMTNEDYEDAAYRELKEELGIKVETLEEIGYFNPIKLGTSSFSKLYKLKYDGEFIIDKDEVEMMCPFEKKEIDELIVNNPEKFSSDFIKIYPKIANRLQDKNMIF